MKLVYVGPHDAVEVTDAGIVAERDKPVEVGEGKGQIAGPIAKRLLEQDTWRTDETDAQRKKREDTEQAARAATDKNEGGN